MRSNRYESSLARGPEKQRFVGIFAAGMGGQWIGDVPAEHEARVVHAELTASEVKRFIEELGGITSYRIGSDPKAESLRGRGQKS